MERAKEGRNGRKQAARCIDMAPTCLEVDEVDCEVGETSRDATGWAAAVPRSVVALLPELLATCIAMLHTFARQRSRCKNHENASI